jgi:hypothetical protein
MLAPIGASIHIKAYGYFFEKHQHFLFVGKYKFSALCSALPLLPIMLIIGV